MALASHPLLNFLALVSMSEQIPLEDVSKQEAVQVAQPEQFDLYQKREKIYTRKIEGFFQRLRLLTGWPLLLGYFGLCWFNWGDRQAMLFDLPARQFHILGITFWPQDFSLLAWALIISAFALFFVTTWLGRVWCGYTCPQTVWTSIFMWVEQVTEGNRNKRVKLDQSPWTADKIIRKTLKHTMWVGIALFTGITFVGYFTPIRELVPDLLFFDAHPWAVFWVVFFTAATYGNAGWLREQVCMYMCPYARFQASMFDKDTLIVSYEPQRGEQRGSRKKGVDYKAQGLGDCIDCQLCVQVCPTGIDIRDGLQYECINCALCIDACNEMMDKMEYPRGLIRYTTENQLEGNKTNVLRPKLLGYGAVMLLMIGLFAYVIVSRTPLELDIIRDRNQLYGHTPDGLVDNTYTLSILNMGQTPQEYQISANAEVQLQFLGNTTVSIEPGDLRNLPVRIAIDPAYLPNVNIPVEFEVCSADGRVSVSEETRFIGPRIRNR